MNLTLLSEIKHQSRLPGFLSVLLHVTIITLALISRPISPRQLPRGLINLALYAPSRLILPADAMAGGGVTAPVLVTEVLPEYSEEARKARFQGTVVLNTVVHEDGSVQVIKVLRGIGFGLDQNAIAAVLQWRFKPARRNGKPVASYLNVEVSFNLR